jgi:hypothetical protein
VCSGRKCLEEEGFGCAVIRLKCKHDAFRVLGISVISPDSHDFLNRKIIITLDHSKHQKWPYEAEIIGPAIMKGQLAKGRPNTS